LIEHHNGEVKEMMGRIEEGEKKLDKANDLNCQLIQQKEDSLEKVKQAEQEAQKVCKHEVNIVQCNVELNADDTQIFVISYSVAGFEILMVVSMRFR
jgi:seryl-tRNA synthetase